MAAPLRKVFCSIFTQSADQLLCNAPRQSRSSKIASFLFRRNIDLDVFFIRNNCLRTYVSRNNSKNTRNPKRAGGLAVAVGLATAGISHYAFQSFSNHKVHASEGRHVFKPSRQIRTDTDHSGVKFTLYQYQNCPFCCKVRAVLDYYGFSYDVIEVNSVTKKHIKWSEYKKVPILVAEFGSEGKEVVLRDSSVIISILESHLQDQKTGFEKLNTFYPCLEEQAGRKMKYDFPNKYFVMYQEKANLSSTPAERNEERKWRKWADDHLVHMLSPNAYRSASEAIQAFNYFSEVGQWEQNFNLVERKVVIYLGAAVMYVMGYILKNKYKLKEDVRESLYDACKEWTKAVGKKRLFMGGDQPNLADLAVFGVLNSIEGCNAFQDTLKNTNIGPWYNRTKEAVENNQGAHPLNLSETSSKRK